MLWLPSLPSVVDLRGKLLLFGSNSMHCFCDEKLLSFMMFQRVRQIILGLGCDLDIRFVNLLQQAYKLIPTNYFTMISEYWINQLIFRNMYKTIIKPFFVFLFLICQYIMDSPHSIYKAKKNQYKLTLYSEPGESHRRNTSEFLRTMSNEKNQLPLASLISERNRVKKREVPKHIVKDRQALYSDVLSLKKHINKYAQTNQKLRTRVLMLQTSREKPTDHNGEISQKKVKYAKKSIESPEFLKRDAALINNLKKITNKYRDELQELQEDHMKLKKLLKYSQINQLKISIHQYLQQNKRLAQIIAEQQAKLKHYEQIHPSIQLLQRKLSQQKLVRHKLEGQRIKLQSLNVQLQNKLKTERERFAKKEKNLTNQIFIERRKAINIQNNFDNYRKESERSKDSVNSNRADVKMPKIVSQQKSFVLNKRQIAVSPLFKAGSLPQSREPKIDMVEQNSKLKKDIEELQIRLKNIEVWFQKGNQIKNIAEQQNQESLKDTAHIVTPKQVQKIESSSQYENITIEPAQIQREVQNKYQAIVNQVCELLTFRFEGQNYSYSQIKRDIQNSQSKDFSCMDVCHMLINEPFYLTVQYSRAVLSFIFEKQKVKKEEVVDSAKLVTKLRDLINDFELKSPQEQKGIIQRCLAITQKHSNQIRSAFLQNKNGPNTIQLIKFVQVLTQYGFSEDQRHMIVGELSIFSQNLHRLNFETFFQRFYVQPTERKQGDEVVEPKQNELPQ